MTLTSSFKHLVQDIWELLECDFSLLYLFLVTSSNWINTLASSSHGQYLIIGKIPHQLSWTHSFSHFRYTDLFICRYIWTYFCQPTLYSFCLLYLHSFFLLVELGFVPTQEALAERNELVLQGWGRSLPKHNQSSVSQQGARATDWQPKSAPYSLMCLWQRSVEYFTTCFIATFISMLTNELLLVCSLWIPRIYR